eukprot:15289031-Alexandrium_andersonii.AAC.1
MQSNAIQSIAIQCNHMQSTVKTNNPEESKWVSPKKMIQGLEHQGEKMQHSLEGLSSTLGLRTNLDHSSVTNKKFQD